MILSLAAQIADSQRILIGVRVKCHGARFQAIAFSGFRVHLLFRILARCVEARDVFAGVIRCSHLGFLLSLRVHPGKVIFINQFDWNPNNTGRLIGV